MASNVSEYLGVPSLLSTKYTRSIADSTVLIGLEIEMESIFNTLIFHRLSLWKSCLDGSLRNRGTEIKFSKPYQGSLIIKAIAELSKTLRAYRIKPTFSSRTGVHIHINISDLDLCEVNNFIYSFMEFEDAFFALGKIKFNRKNNAYCVPIHSRDNYSTLVDTYYNGSSHDFFREFAYSVDKYSSGYVNANFGTFEVRLFDGTVNPFHLLKWINALLAFFQFTKKTPISRNEIHLLPKAFGSHYTSIAPMLNLANLNRGLSIDNCPKPYIHLQNSEEKVKDLSDIFLNVLKTKKISSKKNVNKMTTMSQ